jgi:CHAD domain-containing protein
MARSASSPAAWPASILDHAAFDLALSSRDTFATASRKILCQQIRRVWKQTYRISTAPSPKTVHDLRVALRRLRSAFRLLAGGPGPRYRHDLARIARRLGRVRDLDVLRESLVRRLPPPKAPEVFRRLQLEREQAWVKARQALCSRRYAALLARLLDYGDAPRMKPAAGQRPVLAAAPGLLRAASQKLWRQRRHRAESFSPRQLHRLRIEFKRLRYACEFFAPVVGGLAGAIRTWTQYQDCLGKYRDARAGRKIVLALGRHQVRRQTAGQDPWLEFANRLKREREQQHQTFLRLWTRAAPRLQVFRHRLRCRRTTSAARF